MIGIFSNNSLKLSRINEDLLVSSLEKENIDYVRIENFNDNAARKIDLLIVLGGDGTVLNAVDFLAQTNVPLLSINTGTLGFLSCYENSQLGEVIALIKSGKYSLSTRELMKITCEGNDYFSLNEGVLERLTRTDRSNTLVKVRLFIDGQYVDDYSGDGLIISTPTGSTAYSLSAGGAILAPGLNAFIATPICAHTLRSKPIVFSSGCEAVIEVKDGNSDCGLFIDGVFIRECIGGDTVTFTASGKKISFVEPENRFYSKLFNKLNKWSNAKED